MTRLREWIVPFLILAGMATAVAFSGVAGPPHQVAKFLVGLGAMAIVLLLVLRIFGVRPPG